MAAIAGVVNQCLMNRIDTCDLEPVLFRDRQPIQSAMTADAAPFDTGRATQVRATFRHAVREALDLLVALAIASMCLISAMVLSNWGLAYEATNGTVLEKLHPGSWMVFLAFGLAMLGSGNPARFLDGIVKRQPGLLVFLLTFALAFWQLVFVQNAGFTPLIDTFLMPVALTVLLGRMEERWKRRIAVFMHIFFAANALLGLYEFLTGFRLTPFVAGTVLIEGDWRSTALLGHPLANAVVTGCYVVAICGGGARELPGLSRVLAVGLQMAGMIAFGGRSSLVIMLLFVVVSAGRQLALFGAGARKISLPQAALVAVALPLLCGAVAAIAQGGFFDLLAGRFVDDNGSAQARIIMLRLFEVISLPDLMFGPDQSHIHSLQQLEGIEYGLESFWLATILGYGLIVSLIFFSGLFAFLYELAKGSTAGGTHVLLFFFIIASTSVSLSAKTHVFGLVVAIILVLLRKPPATARHTGF